MIDVCFEVGARPVHGHIARFPALTSSSHVSSFSLRGSIVRLDHITRWIAKVSLPQLFQLWRHEAEAVITRGLESEMVQYFPGCKSTPVISRPQSFNPNFRIYTFYLFIQPSIFRCQEQEAVLISSHYDNTWPVVVKGIAAF